MESFFILLGVAITAYVLVVPGLALVIALKNRDRQAGGKPAGLENLREDIAFLRRERERISAKLEALERRIPGTAPATNPAPVSSQSQQQQSPGQIAAPVAPKPAPTVEEKPQPVQTATPAVAPAGLRTEAASKPANAAPSKPAMDEDENDDFMKLKRFLAGKNFGEVSMMKWWLPRIGGAFAILAALFFSAYVNRNMPPPRRLMELIGVCAAFLVGGLYLERRQKSFGGVVFMVGVVMTYLTSFAAYALPPVRVITDPRTGAIIQALVLGLIVLLGLARRSRGVVLAAFIMTWPMVVFMVYAEVGDILLVSAALMCVAGVLLPVLHERFSFIPWLALPLGGAAMILLGVFLDIAATHEAAYAMGYLALISLVTPLAGLSRRWKVPAPRSLAAVGAALAGVAAYVYFNNFFCDLTGKAYLIVAGGCLAGALIQWLRDRWSSVALQYAVKTSAFLSLWIMTDYAEYTRWSALLVQAAAMSIMGRREKRTSLLLTAAATTVVSLLYYAETVHAVPLRLSLEWWLAAAYPVGMMAAFAWMLPTRVPLLDSENSRNCAITTLALFIPLLALPLEMHEPLLLAHSAASMLVVGAVLFALAFVPGISSATMSAAAATCLAAASFLFCKHPEGWQTLAAILAVCTAVAAAAELREWIPAGTIRNLAKLAVFVVAVCTSSAWLADRFEYTAWPVAALSAAGIVFIALSRLRGMDSLRMTTLIAPLFILRSGFDYNLWSLALAPLWLLAVAYLRSGDEKQRTTENVCATVAGLWLLVLVIDSRRFMFQSNCGAIIFWTALAGVALTSVAKMRQLRGAGLAGLAIVTASLYNLYVFNGGEFENAPGYVPGIAATILTGLILPACYLFARRKNGWDWVSVEKLIPHLLPILTWIAFALPVLARHVVPASWMTPLLAAASCALVVFGIATKARHYRITGLITLLIPIYRLFVYDLDEPLQRIVAFGVGGVLIMCLGYLYHRLSLYMTGTETGTNSKDAEKSE